MNYSGKLTVFCFLLASVSYVQAVDLEKERAAILKIDKEWSDAAFEGRNLERIVSFWADDATVFPPGAPAVVGKDAIRAFVKSSLEMPGFSIRWETTEVTLSADGKFAYAIGQNETTFNDAEGKRITVHGKAVTIWRKSPAGVWKCVIDIWNDNPTGG